MRIALIHVGQETNDFNPSPTTLRDYQSFGIIEGQDMLERFRGLGQIGGYIEAVEQSGQPVETVPIVRGWAVAGGRIDRASYDFFDDKIRSGLAAAGPLDGVALQLHGACASEDMDDVEGAQLQACRDVLGPDIPIVLGLDHHANITRKMVALATAIVGHRTQPHDPFDTGRIGAEERNAFTDMLVSLHYYLHLPHAWGIVLVSALGAMLVAVGCVLGTSPAMVEPVPLAEARSWPSAKVSVTEPLRLATTALPPRSTVTK